MFNEKTKSYIVIWSVCTLLMIVSIVCWIFALVNPVQMYDDGIFVGTLQRAKHLILGTNYAVFDGNTGLAVILALVLYTVVGIRNKNTMI